MIYIVNLYSPAVPALPEISGLTRANAVVGVDGATRSALSIQR